jgi:hypothetical protein
MQCLKSSSCHRLWNASTPWALLQIVDVCIPELEYVRVAQILTIGCEIAEAYKHALATPELRRQFTLETRMSLGAAERFTATDYLQVCPASDTGLCLGTVHLG